MSYKIAAYKVIDGAGQYAKGSIRFGPGVGKTWSSKAALNCALTYWKKKRQHVDPTTGVTTYAKDEHGRYIKYDWPLPEDWVVLELTVDGLKTYQAQQFYGK